MNLRKRYHVPWRMISAILAVIIMLGGIPALTSNVAPTGAAAADRYYPQTNHTLWGTFVGEFDSTGGVPQHGYPLTDVVCEIAENGVALSTQYTERSIFELQPNGGITKKRVGAYLLEGRQRGQVLNPNGPCGAAGGKGDGNGSPITGPIQVVGPRQGLPYPDMVALNPARQPAFPNVNPALAEYAEASANWDYFQTSWGTVTLPEFHYRVITAGTVQVSGINVGCVAAAGAPERRGCLMVLVSHFGETVHFQNSRSDSGFSVSGQVWDMSTPEKVTQVSQALADHYSGRMTASPNGANCGIVGACRSVEWHVVVVGHGQVQVHWAGIYTR